MTIFKEKYDRIDVHWLIVDLSLAAAIAGAIKGQLLAASDGGVLVLAPLPCLPISPRLSSDFAPDDHPHTCMCAPQQEEVAGMNE